MRDDDDDDGRGAKTGTTRPGTMPLNMSRPLLSLFLVMMRLGVSKRSKSEGLCVAFAL